MVPFHWDEVSPWGTSPFGSIFISVIKKQSGKLIRQPVYSPSTPRRGNSSAFPLPTFASLRCWLSASPSRASPCDQRGIPPWNSRLICCTNQSKSAYSSARSPLRGTMPARLRMASYPDCLTSKEIVPEIEMLTMNPETLTLPRESFIVKVRIKIQNKRVYLYENRSKGVFTDA
jgi:hypothetical protein